MASALKTLGGLLSKQIRANVILKDKLQELQKGQPVIQCNCVKAEEALIQRMVDLENDVKYEVRLNSILKNRISNMQKYIKDIESRNPHISMEESTPAFGSVRGNYFNEELVER